ncbi:nitroreductase family protein [Chloroflexota bacterium]
MELKEAIRTRESCRDYEDKPVPEDKLMNVLEAARLAPSGGNRQMWKFVVARDEKKRQDLAKATGGQSHVGKAPIIIAAVALDPESIMKCDVPGYPVNLAIAVDHMTLAAVDEGLGTCWIGAFSQDDARNILGIPEKYRIVSLLTLGFPRPSGREKVRKPIDEIVCYDLFKE